MEITRDEPGRTIELSQPRDPMSWRTALFMLVFIPLWVMPVLLLFTVVSGARGVDRSEWCLIGFCLLWYAWVGPLTVFGLLASRRTVRLYLSRDSDEWVSEDSALLPFLAGRVSIPLHEIERIEVGTLPRWPPRDGHRMGLRLRVSRPADAEIETRGPVFVTGIDRRAEFLEFALRLAGVVGLQAYRVACDTPAEYRIELVRTRGEGMEAVPATSAEADYEVDSRAGTPLPADLPPFDPQTMPGPFRVDRWEPGKAIILHRPRAREGLGGPLFGCGFFVAVAMLLTLGAAHDMGAGRVILGLLCVPWAALYAFTAWHIAQGAPPIHVVIDWNDRVVRLDRDGRKTEVPFGEIERIDVRVGRRLATRERGESHYTSRRVELVLRRVNQVAPPPVEEVLLEVRGPLMDPEKPRRPGAAFGVELARALGVPLRYTEAREQWS